MLSRLLIIGVLLTTLMACENTDSSPSFSYLALGDSYTIGQSVEEDQRWPVQLAAALDNQGGERAASDNHSPNGLDYRKTNRSHRK